MSQQELIERTVNALKKIPAERGEEVADFVEFILKKVEEENLQRGIEQIVQNSDSFSFLKDDEDLYTLNDLKERF